MTPLEEKKAAILLAMEFAEISKEDAERLLNEMIEMAVGEHVKKYIDCGNCRYDNLISTNTPCNGCVNYKNWEAKL